MKAFCGCQEIYTFVMILRLIGYNMSLSFIGKYQIIKKENANVNI